MEGDEGTRLRNSELLVFKAMLPLRGRSLAGIPALPRDLVMVGHLRISHYVIPLIPVVKMYLCCPATSAPAERLFSAASVQDKTNRHLTAGTLEETVLVRGVVTTLLTDKEAKWRSQNQAGLL